LIRIIDQKGNGHGALARITRKKGINGEKSLTGTIYTNDDVLHGIERGWKIEFEQELYAFTFAYPKDLGGRIEVEFDAVHEFFYDMSKNAQNDVLNDGSHTMRAYLDFIFGDTPYNYSLEVDVNAFSKDNFGHRNRLDLFYDIIDTTGVEFSVNGSVVRILERVGNDLSTVVKKGFNLNELRLEKNIGNFVTYQKGLGAWLDADGNPTPDLAEEERTNGRLEVEYLSPLADEYGKLDADPIVDERYTQEGNLRSRLQANVEGSYQISVQIDMADLNKAGYEYDQPHEGDTIMAINDDLGFERKIRIVSYETDFDNEGNVLDHHVTCNSVGMVEESINSTKNIQYAVEELQNDMSLQRQQITEARVSADSKGMNYYGPIEPTEADYKLSIGDIWFDNSGETTVIKGWNGVEWRNVGVDAEAINQRIEEAQQDIDEAKKVADKAVNEINTAVTNAGFTSLNETIGHVDNIASAAQSYAQTAINKADEVQGLATDLSGQVSDFELTVDGFNQVVNDYEGQVSGFRNDVAGMESTVAQYTTEVDEFGNEVDAYANQVSTLENTVDGFNATVQRVETDYDRLDELTTTHTTQISTLDDEVALRATKTELADVIEYEGSDDKTEILSGTDIYTDKADDDSVVHVDIDGKSYQHAGSGKNLLPHPEHWTFSGGATLDNNGVVTIPVGGEIGVDFLWDGTKATQYYGFEVLQGSGRLANTSYYDKSGNRVKNSGGQHSSNGNGRTNLTTGEHSHTMPHIGSNVYRINYRVSVSEDYGNETLKIRNIWGASSDVGYEPPAPTPDYPIEIHSLNDFDVVSSVGRENLIKNVNGRPSSMSRGGSTPPTVELVNMETPFGNEAYKITFPENNNTGYWGSRAITNSLTMYGGKRYSYHTYVYYPDGKASGVHIYPTGSVGMSSLSADTSKDIGEWRYYSNENYSLSSRYETVNNYMTYYARTVFSSPKTIYVSVVKFEEGEKSTPYSPRPKDITENDDHLLIDKINLLLSEPLRSVGDVKDRLFRGSDGLWEVERNVEPIHPEDGTRTIEETYGVLDSPIYEVLPQELQDELNNLRSFQDSNYVYTIINNKTDILSENLKPTLHATFKKKQWYANFINSQGVAQLDSRLTIQAGEISSVVSKADGNSTEISAVKQEVDSITSTVYDDHSGRISKVEQTADGLQTTVASKASQSQVTQLSNLLNSTVEDVNGHTSQISQLSDNINLRVKEGDVLSQINIEAGRTLIQSDRLLLDANSVVFSGNAFIPGAYIENASIDGAKIQDATIGSAKIASLDVGKISGNTSNFVSSAWNNAAGGNVRIAGSGIITTASNNSQTLIQNGVTLTRNPNGATLGSIGYSYANGSPYYTITNSLGTNFRIRANMGSGSFDNIMRVYPGSSEIYFDTDETRVQGSLYVEGNSTLRNALYMTGHNISGVNSIQFANGGQIVSQSDNSNIRITSSYNLVLQTHNGTAVLFDSSYAYMRRTLSMEGNRVTNAAGYSTRSERKYKSHIEPLKNVTNIVEDMQFYSYTKAGERELGIIADEAPEQVLSADKKSVDMYSYTSLIGKSHQELIERVNELEDEVETLKGMIS